MVKIINFPHYNQGSNFLVFFFHFHMCYIRYLFSDYQIKLFLCPTQIFFLSAIDLTLCNLSYFRFIVNNHTLSLLKSYCYFYSWSGKVFYKKKKKKWSGKVKSVITAFLYFVKGGPVDKYNFCWRWLCCIFNFKNKK